LRPATEETNDIVNENISIYKIETKYKSIENLDDFKKYLPANSEIENDEDYLSHRNYQYMAENLKESYHILWLNMRIVLPYDYVMDSTHKRFKSFLGKYIKLFNKNAPEILFKNVHIPIETIPSYNVKIFLRVANIPDRDSLPELENLWTNEVAALFKAKMGCRGEPIFPKTCFLITQMASRLINNEEVVHANFYGIKDVRFPNYKLCKLDYSEDCTSADLIIP
jgi:hypothetical protein